MLTATALASAADQRHARPGERPPGLLWIRVCQACVEPDFHSMFGSLVVVSERWECRRCASQAFELVAVASNGSD